MAPSKPETGPAPETGSASGESERQAQGLHLPVADQAGAQLHALLGGAPANFCVMAGQLGASLGDHSVLLSRIGRDVWGQQAIERLRSLPVDTGFMQVDPAAETGRVDVSFRDGQPQYRIHDPAAWDFMEADGEWIALAARAGVLCFGSLAQRGPVSCAAILRLIAATSAGCVRIFDVNLRAPFYSAAVLANSLSLATVVKLNDEEVPRVLELLGLQGISRPDPGEVNVASAGVMLDSLHELHTESLRQSAQRLLDAFTGIDLVAITRGAHGSLLVRRNEWHTHPGFAVAVVDTIGAGDAFTAALAHSLLRGASLAELNEIGNRCGSWLATQSGAMPPLLDEVRRHILASLGDDVPSGQ